MATGPPTVPVATTAADSKPPAAADEPKTRPEPAIAPATDPKDPKEQLASLRSKKHHKKRSGKGGGLGGAHEEVEISNKQADFVKVVKVESKKAEPQEDPSKVQLSKIGKASQLTLSEDRLGVTGCKGFRTVRGSHGVYVGTFYCEVTVQHLGKTGHARLGWCTRKAELQAPVGFDQFGYCYRDLEGSKVHQGCREAYAEGYGEGDVLGLFIHLPEGGKPLETVERKVVRFKGSLYYVDEPEPKPEPLPGSVVAFSKNGECQGVAFRDILEGTYYPAVSLFTLPEQAEGASALFNFGPDFQYPPPLLEGLPPARASCTLARPATPPPPPLPPAPSPQPADAGEAAEAVAPLAPLHDPSQCGT